MKPDNEHNLWKFLPQGGKNIYQFLYQEEGKRAKFTENPENPILELENFISSNKKFSFLLLPPCSLETVEYAFKNFEEIAVVDYCSERLALFNEKSNYKYNTKLISDTNDFRNWVSSFSSHINFGKVTSFIPSRYARLDYRLRCILKEDLLEIQKEMCSFAVNRSLKGWHRNLNTFENLKNVKATVCDLPSFDGTDAVIVGAGPSLDDTVHKVKQFENKYYIIATDGSLKTLLKNKLKPDIIVSCEDTVMSWQFFDEYIDILKDTPLVAAHNSNSYLISNYPGPICLTRNTNNEHWCTDFICSFPNVQTGRCVGHYAFNLALVMNAGRIIMTGFDLAFKGEVFHPKDMAVPYFHDMPLPVPTTVQSIHGDFLKTDLSMLTYLKDFEYMIKSCSIDILDATEGGALKDGAIITSIDNIQFSKDKVSLKWSENLFSVSNKLLMKIQSDPQFRDSLKTSFSSYLVQSSDNVSMIEKQKDVLNSEKFLSALLLEDLSEKSDKELLIGKLDSINNSILEWAEKNRIEIFNSQNLSEIIIKIKKSGLRKVYCVNAEICPDLLHLCDIQCIDIKTNTETCNYERALWLKNYSVITSSAHHKFWREFIPDKIDVSEVKLGLLKEVNDGY